MYQFGDVLLVAFPFTNATNVKKRPALVLIDTEDNDLVVARISTQTDNSDFDVSLIDWQNEGLLSVSFVRLHKIATLSNTLIDRQLGALTQSDKEVVAEQIKQIFDFT